MKVGFCSLAIVEHHGDGITLRLIGNRRPRKVLAGDDDE